jgi:hypothetical protein
MRLPSPVLISCLRPAMRLTCQLRLDVGAFLLCIQGAGHLIIHPSARKDIATGITLVNGEWKIHGIMMLLYVKKERK